MEYDNNYLYINKGLKGTTIIPFAEIINTSLCHEQPNIFDILKLRRRSLLLTSEEIRKGFYALDLISKTGIININHKDELIHLHGIRNVVDVRAELFGLIKEKTKEFEQKMEERIQEEQRLRESEELAKHDINT